MPVLCYHYVLAKGEKKRFLAMLNDVFESHLVTLSRLGYTAVTLREVFDYIQGIGHLPPRPVVLTFDDGHHDFYDNAYPLLAKYGMKSVVFANPGKVGTSGQKDGREVKYMSWRQLEDLVAQGLVDVESHTTNHKDIAALDDAEELWEEIGVSKQMLEARLGTAVSALAYPYGSAPNYAQKAGAALRKAGYRGAFTTREGRLDLQNAELASDDYAYEMPRIWVHSTDSAADLCRRLGEDCSEVL